MNMKKQIEQWTAQERFEAVFLLAALALIIAGFNGNLPLVIVGLSIILLVFLRRYYATRTDQGDE
jgi:hypothetical protein